MGSLKPGAQYIYERQGETVYAREFGSDPSSRQEVGWEYDPKNPDGRSLHDRIMDDKLWGDIRRAAKSDTTLHEALERVKILYYLSKSNGK